MTKITAPKYGLRPSEVTSAFGSEQLFNEMRAAGWIAPVIQHHKLTLYDAGDVAKCWARVMNGERPTK